MAFSCCGSEEFMRSVKDLRRQRIILCGIEAHVCVQQTAIDLMKDYFVYVAADAIASRHRHDHKVAVERMRDCSAISPPSNRSSSKSSGNPAPTRLSRYCRCLNEGGRASRRAVLAHATIRIGGSLALPRITSTLSDDACHRRNRTRRDARSPGMTERKPLSRHLARQTRIASSSVSSSRNAGRRPSLPSWRNEKATQNPFRTSYKQIRKAAYQFSSNLLRCGVQQFVASHHGLVCLRGACTDTTRAWVTFS